MALLLLRRPARPYLMKRILVLLIGIASTILFVVYFNTLESDYLDLVEQFIASTTGVDGYTSDGIQTPPSQFSGTVGMPCRDQDGWMQEWISSGVMPKCSLQHLSKVDVVYTWVNGSEPLYQKEKSYWQDQSPLFEGTSKQKDRKLRVTERRHREHDELRYSIRSIFKYLGPHQFSSILIVASDFYDTTVGKWIGQIPTWLDPEAAQQNNVRMLFTSELYGDKKGELPVFSSLALESQFWNVPRTQDRENGGDVMVYFNDDMFLASEHSVSDFWNPLVGITIQVDPLIWVQNQNASVHDFQADWNSEWTALRYSNWLLTQRFGWRRRPYIAHHGKALSRTILKELSETFPSLYQSSANRFRCESIDVSTSFLHIHYIIERHRELLLQSFLVHRSDINSDGFLDYDERLALVQHLKVALKERYPRKSLNDLPRAMKTANLEGMKLSKAVWTGLDGYPFSFREPHNPITQEIPKAENQPMFTTSDLPDKRTPEWDFFEMCLTSDFLDERLKDAKVDTKMFFRLLAKDHVYCGDMLLNILIASHERGLHHLLPGTGHPKYQELVEGLNRYAYTITQTSSEFIMAKNVEILKKGFTRALRTLKYQGLAQICVNDDLEYGQTIMGKKMDTTLRGILQGYFGGLTKDAGYSPVEVKESLKETINAEGLEFWKASGHKGGPGYDKEAVLLK